METTTEERGAGVAVAPSVITVLFHCPIPGTSAGGSIKHGSVHINALWLCNNTVVNEIMEKTHERLAGSPGLIREGNVSVGLRLCRTDALVGKH